MIDTIILQIPIDYSAITDHSQFTPSTKWILENPANFYKYTNNPKEEDRKKGIYKPRLTVMKRGKKIYLKIEFSAPKLLFGNNLDEVDESDFNEVVNKLQKRISEMGVKLWTTEIENAEVLGFHPSKNILITNGYTSSFAIRELSKIDLNLKFDLEKVSFRNNGEVLQIYSNRHSIVIYDKINDIKKPPKRAIDKEQTKQQKELFEYIKQRRKNFEILKFEVRLSHKKKMVKVLKKIGFTKEPIFKNIFDKNLCKKILKLYWKKFFKKNLFLFSVSNNPQKILQMILKRYPKTKIKTAIFLVGLYLLCKDEEGIRGFRQIFENYRPKSNWIRLKQYLRKFEDEVFINPLHGFIEDIQRSLDSFIPLKINESVKSDLVK